MVRGARPRGSRADEGVRPTLIKQDRTLVSNSWMDGSNIHCPAGLLAHRRVDQGDGLPDPW